MSSPSSGGGSTSARSRPDGCGEPLRRARRTVHPGALRHAALPSLSAVCAEQPAAGVLRRWRRPDREGGALGRVETAEWGWTGVGKPPCPALWKRGMAGWGRMVARRSNGGCRGYSSHRRPRSAACGGCRDSAGVPRGRGLRAGVPVSPLQGKRQKPGWGAWRRGAEYGDAAAIHPGLGAGQDGRDARCRAGRRVQGGTPGAGQGVECRAGCRAQDVERRDPGSPRAARRRGAARTRP